MFLKITKTNGEVRKCVLRKHLKYGRGKPIPYEEALKMVQQNPKAQLIYSINLGGFEFCTWEVP
ncbi:MAG: hypothetical protein QXQ64_02445 [Candidatus Bathyarchaeia archaeon]|uniref:hypothetical protein n=1 Tax=Candidatus Hadarchaeum sp. TaxID=2883567 RepID=UPI00317617CF